MAIQLKRNSLLKTPSEKIFLLHNKSWMFLQLLTPLRCLLDLKLESLQFKLNFLKHQKRTKDQAYLVIHLPVQMSLAAWELQLWISQCLSLKLQSNRNLKKTQKSKDSVYLVIQENNKNPKMSDKSQNLLYLNNLYRWSL